MRELVENAVTFQIKQRINTELFIYRTAAARETGVKVVTNEGDQQVGTN